MSKKEAITDKPAMAPESAECGFIGGEGYTIGYVDDINGEGAHLVNWTPTRAELRVLGLHYLERYWSIQHAFAAEGTSGSTEWRESVFCQKRFMSIADALGEEAVIPEWDNFIAEQRKLLLDIEERVNERETRSRESDQGEAR